jgi:20S proteasome alpha/beta subunit
MAGARLLRWSPLGNYLLVAGFDKRGFEIWETHTW